VPYAVSTAPVVAFHDVTLVFRKLSVPFSDRR